MKKTYNTPSMLVVDVNVEAIMTCTSCVTNINNGFTVDQNKITGSAGVGEEMDAAGYRSNLWNE